MRHLDLFSGIGGFALATEMVWPAVEHTFCDNEPFAQAILKKHWPNSKIYGDIRTLTADAEERRLQGREVPTRQGQKGGGEANAQRGDTPASNTSSKQTQLSKSKRFYSKSGISGGERVYLLTGGFPCQPFSAAGQRRGTEDSRHLWPQMLRVINDFKPKWIIGENVGGLVTWSGGLVLEQIHLDLEGAGYEVQAFIIPAVALDAPHRRDRVWIVAFNTKHYGLNGTKNSKGGIERIHSNSKGAEQVFKSARPTIPRDNVTDSYSTNGIGRPSASSRDSNRMEKNEQKGQRPWGKSARRNEVNWSQNWIEVATRLCVVDDGLPSGMARPKGWRNAALKGAGNAIVPQVATQIMRAIKEIDHNL